MLAEKVRVAEEESHLLMRKASEAEMEKQRIQLAAIKVETLNILLVSMFSLRDGACMGRQIPSETSNLCKKLFSLYTV